MEGSIPTDFYQSPTKEKVDIGCMTAPIKKSLSFQTEQQSKCRWICSILLQVILSILIFFASLLILTYMISVPLMTNEEMSSLDSWMMSIMVYFQESYAFLGVFLWSTYDLCQYSFLVGKQNLSSFVLNSIGF